MKRKTALVVVLVLFVLPSIVGAAAALNNSSADYYENTSTSVNNSSWTAGRGDATLNNTIHYLTRVGTFVIGTDSGGLGALLTGLVVFGGVLSASSGKRLGIVGGAVAGVATIFALQASGLAPVWLYALGLGALGVVVAVILLRASR